MVDSIVLVTDEQTQKCFENMSAEDAGYILKGLIAHAAGKTVYTADWSPLAKAVYPLIEGQVDRMTQLRDKNRGNGSRGGRPAKTEPKPNDNPNETQTKPNDNPNETKAKPDDNPKKAPVPVPIPIPKEKDTNVSKEKVSEAALKNEFKGVWEAYPKKQGREIAERAYIRARKAGVTREEIEAGIQKYVALINALETDYQFVKQGGTWFNQKAWEDQYDIPGKKSPQKNTPVFNFDQRETNYDALLDAKGWAV